MVIENLKQVKDILCKIPDNLLEQLAFGMGEGCEEDISILGTNEDFGEIFEEVERICPEYEQLVKYIMNIGKAQSILEEQDDNSFELTEKCYENGEVITDVFFDKVEDKVSSPNQQIKSLIENQEDFQKLGSHEPSQMEKA
jgi:hypothetical protein